MESGHSIYPTRGRKESEHYVSNAARKDTDEDMPTLRVELESIEAAKCKQAIEEEIRSLTKTSTWEIVDKLKKIKFLHCKWILKKKRMEDGNFKSV